MIKRLAFALLPAACALVACEGAKDKPTQVTGTATGPGRALCNLNVDNPGPLVRGGKAQIRLRGPRVDVDAKDVPALCGPIYNVDQPKLNAKAGDGLMLETCIPEGSIQVTSYTRAPGKQKLHSNEEPGGTEVLFNRNEAATYSSRGHASDSVVLSQDMWKAEIDVELVDVMGSDKIDAQITIDCPNPSPLELKAKQEANTQGSASPAPLAPPADPAAQKAEGSTPAPAPEK